MKLLLNYHLWRFALLAMLVILGFIAYWPHPVDQPIQGQLSSLLIFLHHHGIPNWFNYRFIEASANVALFVPIGLVSSLAFPALYWWKIGAFGLLISCCMELGQLVFLHNRFATPLDLFTNTSGAVIGALLASGALKKLQGRRLPAADL